MHDRHVEEIDDRNAMPDRLRSEIAAHYIERTRLQRLVKDQGMVAILPPMTGTIFLFIWVSLFRVYRLPHYHAFRLAHHRYQR